MMQYAVLFPGQGSQHVGMGAGLFGPHDAILGSHADAILGWSLRDVCERGPDEELTRTDRAQPALFAVAYALWLEFREACGTAPVAAAGHSLGEYTALAAAGAVEFDDALRLVAARGDAMDRAARKTDGAMAALIGGGRDEAERLCAARREEGGALWVANVNSPMQVVVAGAVDDIAWVSDHARGFGIRRSIPLKVSGAFHCPLMEPAAEDLADAIVSTRFGPPAFPVWANATAAPIDDIAVRLNEQLVSPVRFAESLEAMAAAGVQAFVHVGPGNVTAGMAARTVDEVETHVVSSRDEIEAVVQALSVQ